MIRIAIEINDAGLILAVEGTEQTVAGPSPGFALIDGDELVVGQAAADRARLHPRHVDHRFWDQLDSSVPGPPFPSTMTRADLAHEHLRGLWQTVQDGIAAGGPGEDDEVLLAVPGWYSPQQLGLLLGIARAAGIPFTGLVDSALAAVAAHRPDLPALYLDVHLHRTAATWIEESGDRVVRQRVECAEEAGLIELQAVWAREIAARFVRQTRYDPRHDAAAEQRLFDHLVGWIDTPSSPESLALDTLDSGDVPTIDVPNGFWPSMVETLYERMVATALAVSEERTIGALVLSSRAAALPGLAERLARTTGVTPQSVTPSAAVRGALRHADAIRSSGEFLPFITTLPTAQSRAGSGHGTPVTGSDALESDALGSNAGAPGSTSQTRPLTHRLPPTHLLHDGLAHPLGDKPIEIGTAEPGETEGLQLTRDTAGISRRHCRITRREGVVMVEDLSRYGTFLNGRRIDDRQDLMAGDRLRLGSPGVELQLIAVAGGEDGEPHGEA